MRRLTKEEYKRLRESEREWETLAEKWYEKVLLRNDVNEMIYTEGFLRWLEDKDQELYELLNYILKRRNQHV